jgi:aldehyde dehydrogenase (NAD+)
VAPDYVLVDRRIEEPLLAAMTKALAKFYGDDPHQSRAFGRVVNDAHMDRLLKMLRATKARLVTGGTSAASDRYLAPTVLADLEWDDPVMEEEIFGPLLPVLSYDRFDDVLAELNQRDKPLALYVYSVDPELVERVISETSSGSVCVNHSAVQLAVPCLPFGGAGASGIGAYHGRAGFDTFSHAKGVLRKSQRGELPLMYPPYTRVKRWLLRRFV